VSVFYKNTRRVLSYDVLQQQKTGVIQRGLCPRGGFDLLSVKPVTNTSSSSCANNGWQTPRCARHSPPSVAALFFTVRDSYSWQHCRPVCREVRYSSIIAFFTYPTCSRRPRYRGSCRNIDTPFGMEKLEWWGYPMVKKFRKICLFILTWSMNVTDRRTDKRTDTTWRHRPCLCIASRGKNGLKCCPEFAQNSQKWHAEFAIFWRRILTSQSISPELIELGSWNLAYWVGICRHYGYK